MPWGRARRMVETGKVRVEGQTVTDPGRMVTPQQRIEIVPNARRPGTESRLASEAIAYVDEQVVVVRKPAGINTVPYEAGERGSLQELVRAWLNRSARDRHDRATGDLGIVHRLDRDTSGLLVFTRTLLAKRSIAQQLRVHSVERLYLAVIHGRLASWQTIESNLVRDRGDGLRGSTRDAGVGQRAITHLQPLEQLRDATLVCCRLETGRTHQIRIHLSEMGHPIVGEGVYVRGYAGVRLPAPRLMLHAAVLGFEHPTRHETLRFEEPMPPEMQRVVRELRSRPEKP